MRGATVNRGTEQKSIKGLFKMSKQGQDRFQRFLFPDGTEPAWQRRALGALMRVSAWTDRWLAARAPAT
jgi:hypothetical protein